MDGPSDAVDEDAEGEREQQRLPEHVLSERPLDDGPRRQHHGRVAPDAETTACVGPEDDVG